MAGCAVASGGAAVRKLRCDHFGLAAAVVPRQTGGMAQLQLPVFTHDAKDVKSFRMFASQLYLAGKVRQADLVRTFGVSAISVKRAVKLMEKAGPGVFWRARPTRGPSVLTPAVLRKAQEQLDQGESLEAVAAALGVKLDTMRKAVRDGRLHLAVKKRNHLCCGASGGPEYQERA